MQNRPPLGVVQLLERFSYDLEMKTREQNRNNKRTEIERFDWFIERRQTHLGFGWLSERSGKQTSCPKNFLEIALTSYCNTIGQSNNAFSILGFLWRENEESMFCSFHPLADKTNNKHLRKPFFKVIRKSLYLVNPNLEAFCCIPNFNVSVLN